MFRSILFVASNHLTFVIDSLDFQQTHILLHQNVTYIPILSNISASSLVYFSIGALNTKGDITYPVFLFAQ